MYTHIVVHLMPQEIDWFEWQLRQLKIGSYHLEKEDRVLIDVTLNLNLTDWDKSLIPKQFFITKLLQLETLCDWCETSFTVDETCKYLGCNDKRRKAIKDSLADNILYLDTDVIFPSHLLHYMISSAKLSETDYYIITPQTVRMWDSSWDVITGTEYLQDSASMESYQKNDPFIHLNIPTDDIELTPIDSYKFGGGWFNLLSTKLLKHITIPDTLGPYGVDDLFVMVCCSVLKRKGYAVQQYVLRGMTVIENYKYRWNPYKEFLSLVDRQEEFRKSAEDNFNKELQNFMNR